MNKKYLFAVLLSIHGWLLPGIAVGAEPLAVAPREGILVLRSGGILRGAITRAGQEYYVGVGGGEIRLKADEVELACENLDEAYRIKSAALPTGHVSEHATLAEWCLRQNLFDYAEKELRLAKEADASFPKLTLIERRLDLARRPVQPYVSHAPPKAKEPEKQDEAVEIVRRIPQRSVEHFTSTIQPLLMNGCAAAACHGTASNNKLRLERIALGRPTSYRISQRNLASVLACVDLENPAASPLLLLPLAAHGTAAEAVLTRRDMEKYRQLVAWVTDVTNNITPAAPNNVSTPAAPLLQTMNQTLPRTARGQRLNSPATGPASPALFTSEAANDEPLQPEEATPLKEESADSDSSTTAKAGLTKQLESGGSLKTSQERQGNKFGIPLKEYSPSDPFDPEVFNREFGKRR